jgi:hypothetical protein
VPRCEQEAKALDHFMGRVSTIVIEEISGWTSEWTSLDGGIARST